MVSRYSCIVEIDNIISTILQGTNFRLLINSFVHQFTKVVEHLYIFVNICIRLQERFTNFNSIIIGYYDNIGKVRNKSEDLYRSYEIFNTGIYFAQVTVVAI